eukprot:3218940-Amphidinium_carterae.1
MALSTSSALLHKLLSLPSISASNTILVMFIEIHARGNSCMGSCERWNIDFRSSMYCGLDRNQAKCRMFKSPPDRFRSVRGSVFWKPRTSQWLPIVGHAFGDCEHPQERHTYSNGIM